ncbi:unnamed protein product [Ilex paraguariensis]|uniref:EF-hand domain-containing protein n=1 Tax=Ilex paraguariensis TaxID=185542 RepID=A0ABC8TAP4_9AQUA
MSRVSFLNFQYSMSRKSSTKPSQFTMAKERTMSDTLPTVFQPNVEEMKRVFNKFDTNRDGKISQEEYVSVVKALRRRNPKTETAKAFQAIDSNGDGFIDFEEFMKVHNMNGGVKTSEIQSAFRAFDLDGNGKISAEELCEVMKRLGENCSLEACRKMVRGVDTDGDGYIDMDEFMNMMTHTTKP